MLCGQFDLKRGSCDSPSIKIALATEKERVFPVCHSSLGIGCHRLRPGSVLDRECRIQVAAACVQSGLTCE